jgi:hypothetical protein
MKKIIENAKVAVLALILVFTAGYVKAWTGPTLSPPNGNISAPINVGSSTQTKLGSLIVNAASPVQNAVGLTVFGTTSMAGIQINSGGAQVGQVLTITNSSGATGWISTSTIMSSGSGSSGVSSIIAGSGMSISPSGGTGNVTVGLATPTTVIYQCPNVPTGNTTSGNNGTATISGCLGQLSTVSSCTVLSDHWQVTMDPDTRTVSTMTCTAVGHLVPNY